MLKYHMNLDVIEGITMPINQRQWWAHRLVEQKEKERAAEEKAAKSAKKR